MNPLHTEIIDSKYKVEIVEAYDEICWEGYRRDNSHPLGWVKIPCFTRSEERKFPKKLAKKAHEICQEFKKRKADDEYLCACQLLEDKEGMESVDELKTRIAEG